MTTLTDYAAKVKEMREAQIEYSRYLQYRALLAARRKERIVDALTSEILEGKENNQMKLL